MPITIAIKIEHGVHLTPKVYGKPKQPSKLVDQLRQLKVDDSFFLPKSLGKAIVQRCVTSMRRLGFKATCRSIYDQKGLAVTGTRIWRTA